MTREDTQNCYIRSVNRALDYINDHYADELTLEVLAGEGCFSPCHFHRVFKAIIGETHQEYVNRIRLEKAVLRMDEGASLTDIALGVGFSTPAHFAQSFKARYGVSPKAYRAGRRSRRVRSAEAPGERTVKNGPGESGATSANRLGFTVAEFPAYRVAYVRSIGAYDFRIGFAWRSLMSWARRNKLVGPDSVRISVSYDDPDLTPGGKLRYDACVTVPEGTEPEGPVSIRTIDAGRCAVFPYEGGLDGLDAFYDEVYGSILPDSGLRLRNDLCYRVHHEEAREQMLCRFRNELRVPVE